MMFRWIFFLCLLTTSVLSENAQYDVTISTSIPVGTSSEITVAFTSTVANVSTSNNVVNVGETCPIAIPSSGISSSSSSVPSVSSISSSSRNSYSSSIGSSSAAPGSSSYSSSAAPGSSSYSSSAAPGSSSYSSSIIPSSSVYINAQAGNLTATPTLNGSVLFSWSFNGTATPSASYLQYGNTTLGYNNIILTNNGYVTSYSATNVPMYTNIQAVIIVPGGISSNIVSVINTCSGPCCLSNSSTHLSFAATSPFTEPSDGSYWIPSAPCANAPSGEYGQGGPIVQTGFNYATVFNLGVYGNSLTLNYVIAQPGYYNYTMYISEPQANGPNQRSMSVTVNGVSIFVNLDIWSNCGGEYIACGMSQTTLVVSTNMQIIFSNYFIYGFSIAYIGPYNPQPHNSSLVTRSTNTQSSGTFTLPLYSDGNVTCPTEYTDVYPYQFPNVTVWEEQYFSLFAAKIQPRVQGNPNMRGNWSTATLDPYFLDYHLYPYLTKYPLSTFSYSQRPSVLTAYENNNNNNNVNIPVNSIFVDVNQGNDATGTGTFNSPFQSILVGLTATRLIGGTTTKTLVLRAGTYYVNQTIVLTNVDQGLTITNYPGDTVILSGTSIFIPVWSAVPNRPSVYVSPIPAS